MKELNFFLNRWSINVHGTEVESSIHEIWFFHTWFWHDVNHARWLYDVLSLVFFFLNRNLWSLVLNVHHTQHNEDENEGVYKETHG